MSEQEIERDLTEEAQEQPEAAPAPDPEIETEARKYGWRPKEEFTRDPDGWVDASRFLELPATHVKMLRDQNKAMEQERRELREQLSGISRATEAALQRQREQDRAAFEARLAAIREEQRQAVETADVERYTAARQREERLAQSAPQQAQPQVHPDVASYMASNEWTKDPEMFRFAVDAVENGPGIKSLPPARQLAWAEQQVRSVFSDRFPAPAPSAPPPPAQPAQSRVDGGGLAGLRRSVAESLPAEAREIGLGFVKDGLFKNLEEYAAAYNKQGIR